MDNNYIHEKTETNRQNMCNSNKMKKKTERKPYMYKEKVSRFRIIAV